MWGRWLGDRGCVLLLDRTCRNCREDVSGLWTLQRAEYVKVVPRDLGGRRVGVESWGGGDGYLFRIEAGSRKRVDLVVCETVRLRSPSWKTRLTCNLDTCGSRALVEMWASLLHRQLSNSLMSRLYMVS